MSAERIAQMIIPGLLLQDDPLVKQIQRVIAQTDWRIPGEREKSDFVIRNLIQKRMLTLADCYYTIWTDSRIIHMDITNDDA